MYSKLCYMSVQTKHLDNKIRGSQKTQGKQFLNYYMINEIFRFILINIVTYLCTKRWLLIQTIIVSSMIDNFDEEKKLSFITFYLWM